MDLTPYEGQQIEIEIDGQQHRGKVIRGPARQLVFLEERGPVAHRSDMHQRLGMCRIRKGHELRQAGVVRVLSTDEGQAAPTPKKRSWRETVALADGDPTLPPRDWQGGLLAWAEAVYGARRQVERSRKAMIQALNEAAG